MSYSVKGFPIDRYDRTQEVFRVFKEHRSMWDFVREYLSGGNRKVWVFRHMPSRWRRHRATTVQKIGAFTNPNDVPDFSVCGPQRSPSSVAAIEAQTKQVRRDMEDRP